MNTAIKKSGSIIICSLMATLLLAGSKNAVEVNAAEPKTIDLPVSYMNKFLPGPSETNEEGMNTANIVATFSTDTIQKGTVITLTGLPEDCINFQADDKYTVTFKEEGGITKTYGGWYDGESYEAGTVSYTVQSDGETLSISFGDWRMKCGSGQDACFKIGADGKVTEL